MNKKELCKSRSCLIINVVLGLGITRSNKKQNRNIYIYHIYQQNKQQKNEKKNGENCLNI